MVFDLVPLWTILLGLAIFYYVVFDGFDLGVGMLYGLVRGDAARATVMNSIAPVWDGNETWLIFGGLTRAREIIEEFSLGSIASPARPTVSRARRYHTDHADVGAGLVGAAIGQR
jgi:hypothetical protein